MAIKLSRFCWDYSLLFSLPVIPKYCYLFELNESQPTAKAKDSKARLNHSMLTLGIMYDSVCPVKGCTKLYKYNHS